MDNARRQCADASQSEKGRPIKSGDFNSGDLGVFLILAPFEFNHSQCPIYNVWKQHLKPVQIRGLSAMLGSDMSRGGKRVGAGRKPTGRPRKLVNFTLDSGLVAQLHNIIPPGKRSNLNALRGDGCVLVTHGYPSALGARA